MCVTPKQNKISELNILPTPFKLYSNPRLRTTETELRERTIRENREKEQRERKKRDNRKREQIERTDWENKEREQRERRDLIKLLTVLWKILNLISEKLYATKLTLHQSDNIRRLLHNKYKIIILPWFRQCE